MMGPHSRRFAIGTNDGCTVCYRFCRSPERAAELTQDVFTRCMQKAGSFSEGNFRGWLKVLAVNVCLQPGKSYRWRVLALDPSGELIVMSELGSFVRAWIP